MALTDAKDLSTHRPPSRLVERVKTWLASDHGAAQRTAGMAFLIRVASAAIVFLSQILLARWMGSGEFGVYVYAFTWLLLIGDIIHFGLPTTAQRFIPEYTQRRKLDLLRGFLVGSRWITFAMATAVAVLGAVTVHSIESALDRNVIMPLYLACICLPFYALTNMLDGLARSYNRINLALVPPFVLRPLVLLGMLAAAHTVGLAIDATAAMAALAFAIWTTTLIQLLLIDRGLAKAVEPGARAYDVKGWLLISLPTVVAWSFYTLLTYTDIVVLKQFRPAEEVAYYYAAAKILALVAFVYYSVAAAVAHRFSALHVAGDHEGLASLVAAAVRWTFWPSLAATCLFLAFGRPLLWLFGPNFVEGYPLMFILAIGLLARASVGPAERVLNMLGQQRSCALVYAAAFVTNLAGCILLAPRFGAIGAACAVAAAIVLESALLFWVAKRRLGLHLLIWRRSFTA